MPATFIKNGAHQLAINTRRKNSKAHIVFCGGFKSSMEGSKAIALEQFCEQKNVSYTRFDYSGHGSSDGDFADGNIDSWLSDTLCVIDSLEGVQQLILVGSSMGAWIATLAATKRPRSLAALVTLAAAPDFTERLLLPALNQSQLDTLRQHQPVLLPSDYDDGSPYHITSQLIENSRQHCVLDTVIEIDVPVRMLHGTQDLDVPYQLSIDLMNSIKSTDVQLNLIKNGDHRLSADEHLSILEQTMMQILANH